LLLLRLPRGCGRKNVRYGKIFFAFPHAMKAVGARRLVWHLLTLSCAIFVAEAQSPQAQTPDNENNGKVLRVVRNFYAWYVPAASGSNPRGLALVLRHRASLFTNELFRALKEDSDAQARVPDEIVGLDFDPFLASQNPCEQYEVGRAVREGSNYHVEIYGVCSGSRQSKPTIIAELVPKSGSWVFANFRYPREKTDLLQVLRLLREQRRKAP
jgi:hypothetical protein